ncbi:hypothetical protein [Corallococcus exercitus]|uniref:hypothetical protein n=1 Tax=Corallococcus exercitus TaxID=2316736 RepID=UPI0035D416B7
MSGKFMRGGKVLSLVSVIGLVGCGPELTEQESQSAADVTVDAPAERTVTAACVPSWDASSWMVSATSPLSSGSPGMLRVGFCLRQLSNCGTLTQRYSGYVVANGIPVTKALTFTVAGYQEACQVIEYANKVKIGPNSFQGKADSANVLAEADELNNNWTFSVTF